MLYRPLGNTGLDVSVISFGAWQIGDPDFWGNDKEFDADHIVGAAIDAGINLFDTAEAYGNGMSEQVLGKALGGRRDQVLIASKVSPDHCWPEKVAEACENSLRRLGTDHIDLYQVHWPFRDAAFEDAYAALDVLKHQGKIREIGLSNFGPRNLDEWLLTGEAVSNQLGYNLLFRAPEFEMIPACRHYDLAVLVYMPLMQGLLSGRYESIDAIPMPRRRTRHFASHREGTRHDEGGHEDVLMDTVEDLREFADAIGVSIAVLSLSWLISQPSITSVIVGARDAEQLSTNLKSAHLDIGPAGIAQLNEFTFPIKVAMGANCDMWESETHSRIR